jgi:hypothetical protein
MKIKATTALFPIIGHPVTQVFHRPPSIQKLKAKA